MVDCYFEDYVAKGDWEIFSVLFPRIEIFMQTPSQPQVCVHGYAAAGAATFVWGKTGMNTDSNSQTVNPTGTEHQSQSFVEPSSMLLDQTNNDLC
jgi:hypothetical protein